MNGVFNLKSFVVGVAPFDNSIDFNQNIVTLKKSERSDVAFDFDRVSIWNEVVSECIPSFLPHVTCLGFNTALLVHGASFVAGFERNTLDIYFNTLFEALNRNEFSTTDVFIGASVAVSMFESLDSKLKDLLRPSSTARLRSHTIHGSFVDGLLRINCSNSTQAINCAREGLERRSTLVSLHETSEKNLGDFKPTVIGAVGHVFVVVEVERTFFNVNSNTFFIRSSVMKVISLATAETLNYRPLKGDDLIIVAEKDVADSFKPKGDELGPTKLSAKLSLLQNGTQSLSTLTRVVRALQLQSGDANGGEESDIAVASSRETEGLSKSTTAPAGILGIEYINNNNGINSNIPSSALYPSRSKTNISPSPAFGVPVANHVPYRDHMLTRLLQPSLQGNCALHMVTLVSNRNENISNQLRFAAAVRGLSNVVSIEGHTLSGDEVARRGLSMRDVEAALVRWREQLKQRQRDVDNSGDGMGEEVIATSVDPLGAYADNALDCAVEDEGASAATSGVVGEGKEGGGGDDDDIMAKFRLLMAGVTSDLRGVTAGLERMEAERASLLARMGVRMLPDNLAPTSPLSSDDNTVGTDVCDNEGDGDGDGDGLYSVEDDNGVHRGVDIMDVADVLSTTGDVVGERAMTPGSSGVAAPGSTTTAMKMATPSPPKSRKEPSAVGKGSLPPLRSLPVASRKPSQSNMSGRGSSLDGSLQSVNAMKMKSSTGKELAPLVSAAVSEEEGMDRQRRAAAGAGAGAGAEAPPVVREMLTAQRVAPSSASSPPQSTRAVAKSSSKVLVGNGDRCQVTRGSTSKPFPSTAVGAGRMTPDKSTKLQSTSLLHERGLGSSSPASLKQAVVALRGGERSGGEGEEVEAAVAIGPVRSQGMQSLSAKQKLSPSPSSVLPSLTAGQSTPKTPVTPRSNVLYHSPSLASPSSMTAMTTTGPLPLPLPALVTSAEASTPRKGNSSGGPRDGSGHRIDGKSLERKSADSLEGREQAHHLPPQRPQQRPDPSLEHCIPLSPRPSPPRPPPQRRPSVGASDPSPSPSPSPSSPGATPPPERTRETDETVNLKEPLAKEAKKGHTNKSSFTSPVNPSSNGGDDTVKPLDGVMAKYNQRTSSKDFDGDGTSRSSANRGRLFTNRGAEDDDDGDDLTPLERRFLRAVSTGLVDQARKCVYEGCNVNVKNSFGRDGMQIAARNGSVPVLQTLRELGGDIGSRGPRGDSLFHLAAWNGHVEALKWLQAAGVLPEAVDVLGQTAIHVAARRTEIHVLKYFFLDLGMNFLCEDFDGQLPADCVPRRGADPNSIEQCRVFINFAMNMQTAASLRQGAGPSASPAAP